jgi:hypothetical protein
MVKTHGGARSKAGRKPVDDKAMQITIYPKTSLVKKVGGIEKAKVILINALLKAAK